jgi:hypothetical protein
MAEVRKHRISKRITVAVTACLLLLASYVASWVLLPQAVVYGVIGNPTRMNLELTVYAPVDAYLGSDWPGSASLQRLWWLVNEDAVLP